MNDTKNQLASPLGIVELLRSTSVLYVENDSDIREQLSKFLEKQVGKLYIATNGQEGLDAWRRHKPEVVVTAIMMPVMDGLEMADEIRKENPSIPIIVTTRVNNTEFFLKAIDLGIDKIITKPVNAELLLQAIQKSARSVRSDLEMRLAATVVDASSDAIVITDSKNLIIAVNAAFCEITGYIKNEVIGQPPAILSSGRHSSKFYQALWQSLQETGRWNGEIWNRRKNGEIYVEWLTINTVKNNRGEITHYAAIFADITELKRTEDALRVSRAFHQSINDAMGEIGIGLLIVDDGGHVRFMNSVMKDWFGDQTAQVCYATASGVDGMCVHCLFCLETAERFTTTTPDGRIFNVITTPVQNKGGILSRLKVIQDVTEHRLAEQEIRIATKAFESQECCMFITDAEGVIQRVNCAFTEVTGYSAEEAVGQKPAILKSGRHDAAFYQSLREALQRDGYWQGETWNRRKSGDIYPEWQTITAVTAPEGRVTNYISTFSDITKHKDAENQIRNLAFYDTLTQLPNRRLLLDRLHHALSLSERTGKQGALLYIDLDNFKNLNNTQGHDIGDLLLVEVASRLRGCIREGDTAARLGGDEFIILLENLESNLSTAVGHVEVVGEKIRTLIGQPYFIKECEYHATASIGITLFRGLLKTKEEMLKRVDAALYQAKAAGRNTLRFFDPSIQVMVTARVNLEGKLRDAIRESQFRLYYQPQVNSKNIMTGAEALVRWRNRDGGMVSPADFIPIAEESGLILPLGKWVLQTACAQLAAWAAWPNTAHLTLAVNVSARQFRQSDFVEQVLAVLDHSGANPQRLKLELTESLLLDDVEDIITKMTALKTRGIGFSMDDFGTGYSSLSYLKRLPLDQLKIDQSFVRDVLTDSNDAAIAKTIVTLGQSLGLSIIAEGVETEAQREFLNLNGCHSFQGYLFSKPVPINKFEKLISQYN